MLLSSKSRQASVSHLASPELETGESNGRRSSEKLVFGCKSKHELKMARSKRCKSLLMLSGPFSSSTSSMKSSLMSLLHPTTSSQQQEHNNYHSPHLLSLRHSSSTDEDQDEQQNQQQQQQQMRCQSLNFTPPNRPPSFNSNSNGKPVKMKLFEQPLDKLFRPKAMKQLNNAIKASNSQAAYSSITQNKRKRSSTGNTTTAASLREFSSNSSPTDANNNSNSNLTFTSAERQQLLLSVLPEPIRNLLNELYLRGPSTIGIFRKSPNAKHCKELRQKLESDSQSSVQQFQVTVIASVFKEWLRSLPDCLLMSRLYPQWIDVAKLIEPLYQHQLQRQQSQIDDAFSDNTISGNTSLWPSRSPLTDSGQPLDRAHSCSTMMSEFSINKMKFDSEMEQEQSQPLTLSEFALSERHSECIRIVRLLLDSLNETNLILLRSFICVLWNIANNSEHNKMSANNLGVCVGQSLLNDEHQSSSKSGTSTFSKRHSRSRSQCLLSSTLSLTGSSLQHTNSSYLDSSSAQETAKYVPMLVAFIIENAPALFGEDITNALALEETREVRASEIKLPDRMVEQDLNYGKENQTPGPTDHVGQSLKTYESSSTRKNDSMTRQHLVIESSFLQADEKEKANSGSSNIVAANLLDTDTSNTTTSVFIVNPPKSPASRAQVETQQRPLSATESTSSSRASSSTSGVHSESPAFSSEVDSQNARTTASSSSPSPSSVSSPSSGLSGSPAQNGRLGVEEENEGGEERRRHRESTTLDSRCLSSKGQQLSLDTPDGPIGSLPRPSERYRNQFRVNRYSTFMSVLNRAPKIPVQFATSSYGEAVIYNPNPRQLRSNDYYTVYSTGSFDRPNFNSTSMPNDESVISVKPIYIPPKAQQPHSMQQPQRQHNHSHHQNSATQQYHTILARNQQELRQQRLKEFLAFQSQQQQQYLHHHYHHHHHHHSFVRAPSYLPQSSYVSSQPSTILPAHHQQATGGRFVPQLSTIV